MPEEKTRRIVRYALVTLRWLVIASATFALLLVAGLYVINHLLPRTYVASCLVQLQPRFVNGTSPQLFDATFIEDKAITAKADDVLLGVIDKLDLKKSWADKIEPGRDGVIADADAVAYLRPFVFVRPIIDADILDVQGSSRSPQEAADIANALADGFKAKEDAAAPEKTGGGAVSVLILTRAAPPDIPEHPNIPLDSVVVFFLALFLGASLASFVEIVFLFRRAGERGGN